MMNPLIVQQQRDEILTTACALNNHAVEMMCFGDFKAAFRVLKDAACLMNFSLDNEDGDGGDNEQQFPFTTTNSTMQQQLQLQQQHHKKNYKKDRWLPNVCRFAAQKLDQASKAVAQKSNGTNNSKLHHLLDTVDSNDGKHLLLRHCQQQYEKDGDSSKWVAVFIREPCFRCGSGCAMDVDSDSKRQDVNQAHVQYNYGLACHLSAVYGPVYLFDKDHGDNVSCQQDDCGEQSKYLLYSAFLVFSAKFIHGRESADDLGTLLSFCAMEAGAFTMLALSVLAKVSMLRNEAVDTVFGDVGISIDEIADYVLSVLSFEADSAPSLYSDDATAPTA